MNLDDRLSILSGVGTARAQFLEEMGLSTIRDLLYHVPFRYEKVEQSSKISELKPDTIANFRAEVLSKLPIKTARFRSMIKVRVGDETGKVDLTWFNTPFILSSLIVGQSYFFTGKVTAFKGKIALTNPTVEKEPPEYNALIPVYHESAEINSRFLRRLISQALLTTDLHDVENMRDVYKRNQLLSLTDSFKYLHQPTQDQKEFIALAKKRLAFDEMFVLIKGVLERKTKHLETLSLTKVKVSKTDITEFARHLPYKLTPSQQQTIEEISTDLGKSHPMRRILQGEVGSGKTTIAAFALWSASKSKGVSYLICPTKILAQQHFLSLQKLLANVPDSPVIGLYTGDKKDSEAKILIGTQALLNLKNKKPSLIVVDEEHRFGVAQREDLLTGKRKPHFLSMTATPIPRTVALTALSDQDLSFIVPPKPKDNIKTWVVPLKKRESAQDWITSKLKETKGQAMIVCPFIEESFHESLSAVKSAKTEFLKLKKVFSGFKLELLHGKLDEKEKTEIFSKMLAGKTQILVTTPVVEVGVDIPEANIIVIEGAERFGLAQLHQLRGRVGRRGQPAFCLLFTTEERETKRLEYFASHYDGNMLAEYDLKHRGSGELLGRQQHGFGSLKFASWFDTKLITTCREEVGKMLNL